MDRIASDIVRMVTEAEAEAEGDDPHKPPRSRVYAVIVSGDNNTISIVFREKRARED